MSVCVSPIKGEVARFTLLDGCGVPIVGTGSAQVTTNSWVQITNTPVYTEGTEYKSTKANGEPCVDLLGAPYLSRVEEVTQVCTLDVDLINMVTGNDPVSSATDFVGSIFGNQLLDARYSKEVWQNVGGECGTGEGPQWNYWAFPHEYAAKVQPFTFNNGVLEFSFSSLTKIASTSWDLGDPWLSQSPVSTWGRGKHYAFAVTSVPPPEASCGAVEIGS